MADEDVTLDGKPLQSLRVADLKAALEQRCLPKSGAKSALIKRLKGALMLENLQRTSTPHSGLQPNSQIGEEMSQNSFIKQYLAKQQELLRQRLEREAREAAEANESPAGPEEEDKDHMVEGDISPSYCPDKPAHSMLHLSSSTESATVGSAAICLKDREKDNNEEPEATGLVICPSPGGLQRQDSISPEPLAHLQPRVLRPLVHKMTSEEADEKRGNGELVSQTRPREMSTSEEPGDRVRRTKNVSMPVKQAIIALKNLNKSIRDIAKTLDLSKSTVLYIVKKQERTGDLCNGKRPGRPQKTPVLDKEPEKAGLSICPPPGGQDSESRSRSSSPEPLSHDQPGPLSLQAHKMASEGALKKSGQGAVVSEIGPKEVSEPEEPGTGKRRTKDLSMPVKQAIMRLKNENKSIRDIAKTLSLSKSTVWNIVKKQERTGDLSNGKRPGRPKKTTVLDDQILLGIVEDNPFFTVEQIKNTLEDVGIDVSKNTIRSRLRQHNFERIYPQHSNHWCGHRRSGGEEKDAKSRRIKS